jgi:hypothetical protein
MKVREHLGDLDRNGRIMPKGTYILIVDSLQLGSRPHGPDEPRPKITGPLFPISIYGSPVASLKF